MDPRRTALRKTRSTFVAVVAALVLPVAANAATYKVAAGAPQNAKLPASFAQGLYDADAFYPGTTPLTIHVGDTVRFIGGFHTATIVGNANPASLGLIQPDPAHGVYPSVLDAANQPFSFSGQPKFIYNPATLGPAGGPVVSSKTTTYNSGALFLSLPKGYPLKFAKAGTYKIVCLIHQHMKGTIKVVNRNAAAPTPSAAATAGTAEANADVAAAVDLHVNLPFSAQTADNKNTATIDIGGGTKRFSLFAFYPSALSVKVGTTITFRLGGPNEVHNVGIGDYNYQAQFIQANDLLPQGPGSPNQVNPAMVYGTDPAVNGVRTFTGNTMHGNGFFATPIVDAEPGSPQTASVKVTVTAPGTYTMICHVHPQMVATLNVRP
jgi:plastocyanin